jgi:hypothetical protein
MSRDSKDERRPLKPDLIVILCSSCGVLIGEISFVRGRQILGCQQCSRRTVVIIDEEDRIDTYPL